MIDYGLFGKGPDSSGDDSGRRPPGGPPYEETLAQARRRVQDHRKEGIICPCCDQYAKEYERNFNSGMAWSIINIYKFGGRASFDWVHIPSLPIIGAARSREEGKIAHWGLLEESTEPREDGGRAGWWRATLKGEDFIIRKLQIPKYVYIYNGVCLGFNDSEMVTIQDCLGDDFNLDDLLGRRGFT